MTTSLFDAMQNGTYTTNGMPAFKSTGSSLLDFFSKAGDARGVDISDIFKKALAENQEIAVRTLLWTRDSRGGAGERKTFRDLLGILARDSKFEHMHGVVKLIPEVGRWDDLFVLFGTQHQNLAIQAIGEGIRAQNGLCAKWMPRQGENATILRNALNYTPKQWRKTLVNLTKVVETQMCNKQWSDINYQHVPSRAIGKYAKAFGRNDSVRFTAFKQKVETGEAKINAAGVFPYDVVHLLQRDQKLAEVQWKALPDYVQGSDERAICVVDVSGSMDTPVGGYGSGNKVSCMDVAISLGIYTSERLEGIFKNTFITFTDNPKIIKFKEDDSLSSRVAITKRDVGYSTNLEGVFDAVLNAAVQVKLPESQMPTKIVMISDMQFNAQVKGRGLSAVPMIRQKYEAAGYKMPQLVFWNVGAAKYGNSPTTIGENGVAMVSGFSPAILTSILTGKTDAIELMLDAVGKDRYNYLKK